MENLRETTIKEIDSLKTSKNYLYEYKGSKYVVKKKKNSIKIEPRLSYFVLIPLFLFLSLFLHPFFYKLFMSIKFDYFIDRYNIHSFFTVFVSYVLSKKILFIFKKDKKYDEFKNDLENYGYKLYKPYFNTISIIVFLLLILLILFNTINERG
ncbi:hypothetical protein [Empedobacter sp. R132-2]|uniref:hypothetical protein n=1 Tax=Empedobacter sp. R132-2 TaxID=2746740 RepID=UPI0025769E28|nr:hypothetical protein [Empedobacter sp. R132-2]MDM1138008.1 hypothetical protein [Empedobacter sp. R132-2]